MIDNNLNKVEKNLRYLAKRNKSIKFSLGLTILFLMMGVSAFSEEILKNSVENLHSKIKIIKKENEKELSDLRLELIQLMEQGNQVIKSPWSSWQFAIGYTYNSSGKIYKGYGDKKADEILTRGNQSNFSKFLESSTNSNSYGLTDLRIVSEPPAEIEISAGIRPKSIDKKAPSYTPMAPAGALPPFEPKLISPPAKPSAPVEVSPTTFDPSEIKFKGKGFWQHAHIGILKVMG